MRIRMVRMRCTRCRRPWSATPSGARLPCPFCGSAKAIASEDILVRAMDTRAARRAWLFARRAA
ncbi:MAG: hypothetical protein ACJ768_09290 [Gaiellaceae bacterium]